MNRPNILDYKNDIGYKYRDYICALEKYCDCIECAFDLALAEFEPHSMFTKEQMYEIYISKVGV